MIDWIGGLIAGVAVGAGVVGLASLTRNSQERRARHLRRTRILGLRAQRQARCDICGASTEQHAKERCKGICGRQE
jgi:hypothetical protein